MDSDEEWEEEEPGESLHGSDDDQKDKESEDDYEVDNDFFVPHGHLSDEEMQNEEENGMNDNTPETQKLKLKVLQDEFNDEMKKKTEKIKPRVIGCIWVNEGGEKPDNCPSIFWELLVARRMICERPIELYPVEEVEDENLADNEEVENLSKKRNLSDVEIADLIKLIHGNLNNYKFMVQEFQKFREKSQSEEKPESLQTVTNKSIIDKIKEIAKWELCTDETSEMKGKYCWIVQKEFLEKFCLVDYPVKNSWKYTLEPKRQLIKPDLEKTPTQPKTPKAAPLNTTPTTTTPTNGIAKFTKVLTTEEKKRAFYIISQNNENKDVTETVPAKEVEQKQPPPAVKKRVPLLMSVPRGQAFSEQNKNMLIKNFLKKPDTAPTNGPTNADLEQVDCIVLD